jgi:hypothetical protein
MELVDRAPKDFDRSDLWEVDNGNQEFGCWVKPSDLSMELAFW